MICMANTLGFDIDVEPEDGEETAAYKPSAMIC